MTPVTWLSGLFSKTGASIVESVGSIIDNVHTSTEEKIAGITSRLIALDTIAAEREERMQEELTARLELDTNSDSWLSKNIRPLVIGYLTVVVTVLAFATIFTELTKEQVESLGMWVGFFTTLMVTAYGFYFGSRGTEKVVKVISKMKYTKGKG